MVESCQAVSLSSRDPLDIAILHMTITSDKPEGAGG